MVEYLFANLALAFYPDRNGDHRHFVAQENKRYMKIDVGQVPVVAPHYRAVYVVQYIQS